MHLLELVQHGMPMRDPPGWRYDHKELVAPVGLGASITREERIQTKYVSSYPTADSDPSRRVDRTDSNGSLDFPRATGGGDASNTTHERKAELVKSGPT
jgi:hypothetical protein